MKAQEFLDMETISNQQWATQQFVINLSKTRAEQIRRVLSELNTILYKSWSKDLTFRELLTAIEIAKDFLNDKDVDNEAISAMED